MNFEIIRYNIEIEILTGLHIGGSDNAMHIGGVDKSVIKNPSSGEPYIPGSSVKGKVRSLLTYLKGEENMLIKKIFGTISKGSEKDTEGITRLIFADLNLNDEYKNKSIFEVKAETAIDRTTGTAKKGSLRLSERVVSGVKFSGCISMRKFENDSINEFQNMLFTGLKLLEYDALGGSGSRGYGRVKVRFADEAYQKEFEAIKL